MNDLVENVKITGEVTLDNENIYGENVDTTLLRKRSVWFPAAQSIPR